MKEDKFVPTAKGIEAYLKLMARMSLLSLEIERGATEKSDEIVKNPWPKVEGPRGWK